MIALVSIGLSGCFESSKLFPVQGVVEFDLSAGSGNFAGCVAATPLDTGRIEVSFEFPKGASRVSIYRNGTLVFASGNEAITSFVDSALDEGRSYTYTCEATINDMAYAGYNALNLSTLSFSAPLFSGATSSTATSGSTVTVNWAPTLPGSVAADSFQVFYNIGSTVDWTNDPKKIIQVGSFSTSIEGLGDELTYAFGVRACSASGVCDSNTQSRVSTLPDSGAPRTQGAVSVTAINNSLRVSAPWIESEGAVKRRRVYFRTGAVGGTNLADYTLDHTAFVGDLSNPSVLLIVTNGVAEFQTYHVMVIDEDPSGNQNSARNVVTVTTGDLTAPVFAGVSAVALGTHKESEVNLDFTAVARQNSGETLASGTSHYLVYMTEAAYPIVPTDPCLGSVPYQTASSESYAPGARSLSLSGLLPRKTYRFCMQARDNAGNFSLSTNSVSITSLDQTAPSFDGLQSFLFNPETGSLELIWNPSSSSDISRYRIKLWRNNPDPALGTGLTSLSRAHGSASFGTVISLTEFPFVDNDTVYAQVDACDTAGSLPGGAENCTSGTVIRNRTLPDITPPPGFVGIRSAGDLVSTVNGEALIKWFAPAVWTDYRGFRIFSVNPDFSLSFLKDCGCPGGDCSASGGYTQCNVTGLTPYRTYKFHVRAYDAAGNVTILDPSNATKVASKRVADTETPSFTSGLSIGPKPTYVLTYSAASDNQYALETGAFLNYEIYRKAGTPFSVANQPFLDGSMRGTTTQLSFSDAGFMEGTTYFYSVCARDASSNRTCDGTVRSFTVSDATPPVVTSLASTKTSSPKRKNWNLTWSLSDNVTTNSNIRVNVYEKYSWNSPLSSFLATDADVQQVGSGAGLTSLSGLAGPVLSKLYVNYRVEAIDSEDNLAAAYFSVYSDNTLTLTSIAPSQGLTSGGKLLFIRGKGFSTASDTSCASGTRVWLGTPGTPENECTSVQILDDQRITCFAPAKGAGASSLWVTQPDGDGSCGIGSQATLSNAYTYSSNPQDICDDPGGWASNTGGRFANSGAGVGGSSSNPFIICNASHLQNIQAEGWSATGKYYKLGANINLENVAFTPIVFTSSTGLLELNGNNLAILNYGGSSSGSDNSRVSGLLANDAAASTSATIYVKDLSVVNAKVTISTRSSGALVVSAAPVANLSNISATGELSYTNTSTDPKLGGLVGLAGTTGSWIRDVNVKIRITSSSGIAAGSAYGGVLGWGTGHVDRATADVTLIANGVSGAGYAGGIAGNLALYNGNLGCPSERCGISDAKVTGTIRGRGFLGGVVGYSASGVQGPPFRIQRSTASVALIATTTGVNAGGIAGLLGYVGAWVAPAVIRSTAEGSITNGYGSAVLGGLVGYFQGQPAGSLGSSPGEAITESYSKLAINSSVDTGVYSGGLVGHSQFSGAAGVQPSNGSGFIIRDSYAAGSQAGGAYVGGIQGAAIGTSAADLNSVIQNTYATGTVSGSVTSILMGLLSNGTNNLTRIVNSYYNRDLAPNGTGQSLAVPGTLTLRSGSTATSVTTSSLSDQNMFLGWDFATVWYMDPVSGRPKLQWARDAGLDP